VVETLALLHREQIPLWPGTDDTIGFSLHRELELYVKAGMSSAEALRVATYDCDRYLGRDQLYGSIERGKQADFILTPGDPSQDIKALHSIRMVVKGGVVYFPSELHEALGITPFATPPKITQPKPAPPRDAPDQRSFGTIGIRRGTARLMVAPVSTMRASSFRHCPTGPGEAAVRGLGRHLSRPCSLARSVAPL
jgi:hypothetical protein